MRRLLLAMTAGLALAGCTVDLEGAACEAPGSTGQCPSGQRCGNDLRCSSRAAACAAQCTPGDRQCVGGDVRSCTGTDPVCGAWELEVGCGPDLVCRGAGAAAACFCPDRTGTEVVVDVSAGGPVGAPAPTGVRTPAACRFPTLEQGLAAARDVPGAVVVAAGAAATYPVTATLAIPAGVTLRGDDDPPSPASRVLSLEGDLTAGVTLADGAALSGFTVRNGSAPAGAVGVAIACAAGTATARLQDVSVEAVGSAAALASGVRAEGSCPVELLRVTVQGASGPGLLVAREAPAATLLAADSTFDGNGEGVRLAKGDLTLQRALVKGSTGAGVTAAEGVSLTMEQSTIRRNGDTGLVIQGVVVQPGTQRLRLVGNRVCGNASVTLRGTAGVSRAVGGVYLSANPPADTAFLGNAVHGNAGDQLMVAASASVWPLDGAPPGATACGPDRNVFAGYVDPGRGIFAAYAHVSARWNAWASAVPSYETYPPADPAQASVDAGNTLSPQQVCVPALPGELTCD